MEKQNKAKQEVATVEELREKLANDPKRVKQDDEYRKVARKVKERILNELPVLEDVSCAIKQDEKSLQLLPLAIHNIAVILPNKVHKFLVPMRDVYTIMANNGKPDTISHDAWKSVKSTRDLLTRLAYQEESECKRQRAATLSARKRLEKQYYKAKDEAEINGEEFNEVLPPFDIEREEEFFMHVECDISSSAKSFIFWLICGYEPAEEQIEILQGALKMASELLTTAIEKKKVALETCNDLLGE